MADRILAWHVACGSGIMTVNSPSGNRPTLQSDTWLWDDMSLNSPGGNTLQCGMCLWNHDSEFAPWQHPAMWQVDDMPWNSPKTSAILEFYIWFRFRPHHRSRHVILHQSPKFCSNRTTLGRKKLRHVDFQDGGSPIMGSLKSPCIRLPIGRQ